MSSLFSWATLHAACCMPPMPHGWAMAHGVRETLYNFYRTLKAEQTDYSIGGLEVMASISNNCRQEQVQVPTSSRLQPMRAFRLLWLLSSVACALRTVCESRKWLPPRVELGVYSWFGFGHFYFSYSWLTRHSLHVLANISHYCSIKFI